MRTWIAVSALLLALAPQDRPAPDAAEEKYGPHERNVLDLWKAKSEKPAPLVVFIHGGGFRAGSKSQVPPGLIRACLAEGISVASINYRLTDSAPFPAPMHDAARAIQYLRLNKAKFGLDGRVVCTGGSAGAGISLWLAFHDDLADPKAEDPVLRESTRISGALPQNGQCSYDPRWIREHVGGRAHEHAALKPFYALGPGEENTEKAFKLYEEASPITHLTKDDPPVYMTYGGNDEPSDKPGAGIHSEKFGLALQKKMKELGLECEVKVGRDDPAGQLKYFKKRFE